MYVMSTARRRCRRHTRQSEQVKSTSSVLYVTQLPLLFAAVRRKSVLSATAAAIGGGQRVTGDDDDDDALAVSVVSLGSERTRESSRRRRRRRRATSLLPLGVALVVRNLSCSVEHLATQL